MRFFPFGLEANVFIGALITRHYADSRFDHRSIVLTSPPHLCRAETPYRSGMQQAEA